VDRSGFLKLVSPEGSRLLAELEPMDSKTDVVKLVSRLRKDGHDPELIATVLSQVKLRRKAREKFGEFADQMLFSQAGLEQASRLSVAAIHAGRFRKAGISAVADLGCGIGAEAMAMASLDINVSAFDSDELTAALATYNLAHFSNVTVEQADVTKLDLSIFGGLFFDPARRDSKNRKFNPEDFSPSFSFVLEKAKTKPTIIKLGPGHPHDQIPEAAEAVWVSINGDLVELSLYFNEVKRADVSRSALLISSNGTFEISAKKPTTQQAEVGEIQSYLYEPDNALIRSHLIANLAEELNLKLLSSDIAYLTGNIAIDNPWISRYRILDNLPFDRKKLKAYLKDKNTGPLEIKKRGADITPEALRKELNLKGSNPATIVVTRIQDQHRVLIVEPE